MPAKKRESLRRLSVAPLRDFIQVRDALARELRGRGELEEARLIAGMRKPPVGLWIANQLARLAPDDVKALVEASARLRRAQSAGGSSGEVLREAMRVQREALARLAEAAGRAALEAGTRLTLELQRRVQNTVQAAAVSEPEALREGSLEKELMPAGFGELLEAEEAPQAAHPGREHGVLQRSAEQQKGKAAAEREKKEEAAARARAKELARALAEAEEEAHRLDAQAKKLEAIAKDRALEATSARERADEARRSAEAAAKRAGELRGERTSRRSEA